MNGNVRKSTDGNLTLEGNAAEGFDIRLAGAFTENAAYGNLTMNGDVLFDGEVLAEGNVPFDQRATATQGYLDINGNLRKTTDGNLTLEGNAAEGFDIRLAGAFTENAAAGNLTMNGDVLFDGAAPVGEGGGGSLDQRATATQGYLDMNGNVRKSTNGNLTLEGNAAEGFDIRLAGAFTENAAAGNLTMNGDVLFDGVPLGEGIAPFDQRATATQGYLDINGNVRKSTDGNLTLDGNAAEGFDIRLAGAFTENAAVGNLTMNGDVLFDGAAPEGGDGGSLDQRATATQGYLDMNGNVRKSTDGNLTLEGNAAEGFDIRLAGAFTENAAVGNLTMNGDILFDGVAQEGKYGDPLDQRATATQGYLDINGNVRKSTDGNLTLEGNAAEGFDIRLAGAFTENAAFGNLTMNGDVLFDGEALEEGLLPLDQRATATYGYLDINGNVRKSTDGNLTLEGNAADGFDIRLSGAFIENAAAGNLTMAGNVDLDRDGDQRIDAIDGTLRLDGMVNKTRGDVTFGGSDGIEVFGGSVTSTGNQTYEDAVRIDEATLFRAADSIDFNSTLDGAFDVTIDADGNLRFGGDVGGASPLASLLIMIDGITTIDGALIRATGDINLNPDGRGDIPTVATIAASNTLLILSIDGKIFVGVNEKITGLGDVTFRAAESVTLNDVSAFGNLTVDAPVIFIRTRDIGTLLDFLGLLVGDAGVDFIAGGRFFFSVRPTLLGGGLPPRFSSPHVNMDALGTLGGFLLRLYDTFSRDIFQFQGTVLDLRAQGPDFSDVAEALAEDPAASDDGSVRDEVLLDPVARQDLRRIGIFSRDVRPSELRDNLVGRELFDDTPTQAVRTLDEHEVALPRLRRAALASVLERYRDLAIREVVDEETGEVTREERSAAVRATLSVAWESYGEQAAALSGRGFRQFLESTPAQAEALRYIDGVREMVDRVGIVGLSPVELRICQQAIYINFSPTSIPEPQFVQAVQG